MKNITMNFTLLFILMWSVSFISCSDFLDREPDFDYTNEGFYQSDEAISFGLTGVYESVYYTEFQTNNTTLPFYVMMDHFTGMGIERSVNTSIGAGVVTTNNGLVEWAWRMPYKTITRANSILEGAQPHLAKLSDKGKRSLAEAKVLKAWSYYHLAFFFGDAVLYKTSPSLAEYQIAKSTQVELVDYALALLDEALAEPAFIFNKDASKNLGRVDRSVALGIKARIGLNAGSLNVGGKAAEYYKIARDASSNIIQNSGRSLNTNFEALFDKDGQIINTNNELMFQLMYSDQGKTFKHYVALGHASRLYGQSGRFPTQMYVDQFECIDGKRIDESPLYNPQKPSENRDKRFSWSIWMHGDTIIGNSGGTKLKFIYDVYRDTVAKFNYKTSAWDKVLNSDVKGGVAPYGPVQSGVGYIWKKYLNSDKENIFAATNNIVLMRYAEILLMYAEAKIELNELDQSVYDAINKVRTRAGQPTVDASRMGNVDKMRQLVRRERKVELMLEGLHFFDMRRWKVGDLENEEPTYGFPNALLTNGMLIEKGGYNNATPDMIPNFKKTSRHDLNDIPIYGAYAKKVIGQKIVGGKAEDVYNLRSRDLLRAWDNKLYLWPVPQTEMEQNKLLVQNPLY